MNGYGGETIVVEAAGVKTATAEYETATAGSETVNTLLVPI